MVYLFLLPIVLIVVLSVALGGLLSGDGDGPIALPVVNLDPGGDLSHVLIDALDGAGGLRVTSYDQADAQARLEALDVERVLTIPPGVFVIEPLVRLNLVVGVMCNDLGTGKPIPVQGTLERSSCSL